MQREAAIDTAELRHQLAAVRCVLTRGHVAEVSGPVIKARIEGAAIGDLVEIECCRISLSENQTTPRSNQSGLLAEVVGFSEEFTVLSPFGQTSGIASRAAVYGLGQGMRLSVGPQMIGCAVDALGRVIERFGLDNQAFRAMSWSAQTGVPRPFFRQPICAPLATGVRAIDGFLTMGCGQRLSVLAEPGVGKSTLLAMIARGTSADLVVFGLIGERGREAGDLLKSGLDEQTLNRSIVVVSTSDEPPALRIQAADTAMRICEYFRDQGANVLLEIDSLTRLCRAYREVGLAAGEVPVRRGYPPSVFSRLPVLIERAGMGEKGSITALYTFLTSAEADADPMIEEVQGLTDGHIVLSRKQAEAGRYPAIDVLRSLSRLAPRICPAPVNEARARLRRLLSRVESERELVVLGGKVDEELQIAIELEPEISSFLRQVEHEVVPVEESFEALLRLDQIARERGMPVYAARAS